MTTRAKNRIKETDIAAKVVKWLIEQGWEVYQEVPISYSAIVDIVAVKRDPRIAWLIEVKTSANGKLYWQAINRQLYSPYVSVAVPWPKRFTSARQEIIDSLAKRGVGFLHVHETGCVEIVKEYCSEEGASHFCKYNQEEYDRLFSLHDEFKTFCPAGSSGGYLTPYKMTCMNIAEYVREHPGCSLREAVKGSEHHYASDKGACSTLGKWGVRGVEFRTCLFVEEENNERE